LDRAPFSLFSWEEFSFDSCEDRIVFFLFFFAICLQPPHRGDNNKWPAMTRSPSYWKLLLPPFPQRMFFPYVAGVFEPTLPAPLPRSLVPLFGTFSSPREVKGYGRRPEVLTGQRSGPMSSANATTPLPSRPFVRRFLLGTHPGPHFFVRRRESKEISLTFLSRRVVPSF